MAETKTAFEITDEDIDFILTKFFPSTTVLTEKERQQVIDEVAERFSWKDEVVDWYWELTTARIKAILKERKIKGPKAKRNL
jgi:hypothetical protein